MARVFKDNGQLLFWCPACGSYHVVNVEGENRPMWKWNGDYDKPTFEPSVKVTMFRRDGKTVHSLCHSFVTDGQIRYLNDCTHKEAGKTIPLPVV